MINRKTILVLLAGSIAALADASNATSADPAARFVSESSFTPVDPDTVWNEINAGLSSSNPDTVFLPTSDLGPMPLAVLAVETMEGTIERVRYRLRYGVDWIEEVPGGARAPISYVEVIRFNLGPAIRQDLIESLGAEYVVGPEEFGVGAHVAWRFVTRPLMGNRAIVVAAGRGVVPDEAASDYTCLGSPCLSPHTSIDDAAPWSEMEPAEIAPHSLLPEPVGGNLSPVAAVELLLGEIDSIETDMAPAAPSVPDWAIEAVIEINLGQDIGLEAAYRWGGLLDDSVAAIWERLASGALGEPGQTAFRASAHECARSPGFAEPGRFCP
ncbi:MAG TPA: hypothetical protein VLQ65_04285 [Saliniramus sp.]|nr:hypothetical protein [Saliniramus sp.]